MDATVLLCDWAEAVNGKLYIMGGGWSRAVVGQPVPLALAIKLGVPWDEANKRIPIRVSLLTEDGKAVNVDDKPVVIDGELEVGRPAGLKRGSVLDAAIVFRFAGLQLDIGGYSWHLQADGKDLSDVPFEVVERM